MRKDFFTSTFGKVTAKGIDEFTQSYKCSEEEEKDVLKYYTMFKGNFDKMLECVMCSDGMIDKERWVEDYIHRAIRDGSVEDFSDEIQNTLENKNNPTKKSKIAKKGKGRSKKSLSKSKKNQLNQEEEDDDIKEEEEIEDSNSIDDDDDDDYDDNNLQGDELSQSDSGGESDVDDDMVKTSQE